jgi:hypothetical protein
LALHGIELGDPAEAHLPSPGERLGHRVAEANKREMRRRFVGMAERLGAPRPKQLADGLLLLVEGAYAISQTLGGAKGPGIAIAATADALAAAHVGRRDAGRG